MPFDRCLPAPCRLCVGLLMLALMATGCSGSGGARQPPPDQRYGHRYEEASDDGRRTLAVTAPEERQSYNQFPVPVDSVIARAAPFRESVEAVPVELLIKGALPDRCLSISGAEPERDGHLVRVAFEMRWPVGPGAGCERRHRPYRFYLSLPGRYPPGDYMLKVNGTPYPFTVRRG